MHYRKSVTCKISKYSVKYDHFFGQEDTIGLIYLIYFVEIPNSGDFHTFYANSALYSGDTDFYATATPVTTAKPVTTGTPIIPTFSPFPPVTPPIPEPFRSCENKTLVNPTNQWICDCTVTKCKENEEKERHAIYCNA